MKNIKVLVFLFTTMAFKYLNGQSNFFINPSVHFKGDSLAYVQITNTIDSFFLTKNQSYSTNSYWDSNDIIRYKFPFLDLYNQEISYKLKDTLHYRPSVIEILPATKQGEYLVKLAYLGNEDNKFSSLKFVYSVLISKDKSGIYKLKRPTNYLTKNWLIFTTKSINFHVSPLRKLNKKDALRLDSFNTSVARLLDVPIEKITYYSCENAKALFEVKGYDYISNMYYDSLGGQCEPYSNIVYSGMNSEWYPHELVHIYTHKHFPQVNRIADEGFCTFLGGSYNLSLEYHLKMAKAYVKNHPTAKLDDLLFEDTDIGEHTSSTYTLGGLLCKLIYQKHGIKGIKEWLSVGSDEKQFYNQLNEKLNIKSTDLHTFLYNEVSKY